MTITSIENNKIKELKKLNIRKYRDEINQFLVEGTHLIEEAYKADLLIEVIVLEGETLGLDIPITYATSNVMATLSNLVTPAKFIGVCRRMDNSKNILDHVLILDCIQDPGNLGTILRSASAFNIGTIIIGDGSVDIYNSKVLRSTQGLLFNLNIITGDLSKIILKLKKTHKIIGTSMDRGVNVKDISLEGKYAIVMGNEGQGLSNEMKSLCDDYVFIKMNDECESLNVAIACSIILYELDK